MIKKPRSRSPPGPRRKQHENTAKSHRAAGRSLQQRGSRSLASSTRQRPWSIATKAQEASKQAFEKSKAPVAVGAKT